MRRLLGLAAAVAIVALAWFAFRVARAQLAPANLLGHMEGLATLAWVGLVGATVAASLRQTAPPHAPTAKKQSASRRRLPLAALLAPDFGLPIALDRPVLLVGPLPTDHVQVQLPGLDRSAGRIERRDGVPFWVPDPACPLVLLVDGTRCDAAVALTPGARLELRSDTGSWTATVKGGSE